MNVAATRRSVQNAAIKPQMARARLLPDESDPASANVMQPKLTRQRPMNE